MPAGLALSATDMSEFAVRHSLALCLLNCSTYSRPVDRSSPSIFKFLRPVPPWQVFRDEADGEDLKLLAAECLGVSRHDPSSRSVVDGFCKVQSKFDSGVCR